MSQELILSKMSLIKFLTANLRIIWINRIIFEYADKVVEIISIFLHNNEKPKNNSQYYDQIGSIHRREESRRSKALQRDQEGTLWGQGSSWQALSSRR